MNKLLADFFEKGIRKTFLEGEIILRGEEASGIFYIAEGFVKVYSISDEGSQYVHVIYGAGEIFPLIWAIKGLKRRVFYEAVTAAVVWEIPRDTFLEYIAKDAGLANLVLEQLAEQFYIYADRIDNLQYKSAYERVVYRLLFIAGRFGVKRGKEVTIEAPLTHELIAQSINLARESVSRQIERLEAAGLVEQRQGHLLIKDIHKLSREFSEPVSLDLWGLDG